MLLSDIENALTWEYNKVKSKGYHNFTGLFLLFLYFYSIPKFIFYIYPSLPYEDQFSMYVFGTFIVHSLAYWPIHIIYSILYKLNIPFIESCRLNNEPWPWESPDFIDRLKHVLKITLINQLIMIPTILMIFSIQAKYDNSVRLPSMTEMFLQLMFFLLCEDLVSFWTHKMFHWGILYKTIHKIHHNLNITFSMAAEYAHPIEFIVGNSIPVGVGPLIFGKANVHYITWYIWVAFRIINSAEAHSGYDFPWAPFRMIPFSSNAHFHDYHHSKNVGNFSTFFMFWDTIMGTHRSYMNKYKDGVKKAD